MAVVKSSLFEKSMMCTNKTHIMVIEWYKEEGTRVYNIGVWKLLLNSLWQIRGIGSSSGIKHAHKRKSWLTTSFPDFTLKCLHPSRDRLIAHFSRHSDIHTLSIRFGAPGASTQKCTWVPLASPNPQIEKKYHRHCTNQQSWICNINIYWLDQSWISFDCINMFKLWSVLVIFWTSGPGNKSIWYFMR